jgi:TolB protein
MNFFKLLLLLFSFVICFTHAQENGYEEIKLTNGDYDNRYATYNKNGTLILFESNRDGRWQVYTMDINGGNQKRIIVSNANDRRPTWHPYKNIILFESDRSGTNELYTFDIGSNKTKRVNIPLIGNKYFGQFVGNGVELLFSYEKKTGEHNIYRVHKKGKLLRKLVDNGSLNSYPKTNRRGNIILYHSDKNNMDDTDVIYTYNVILKENSKLTLFKDDCKHGSWPNKGNRIVLSTIIDNVTKTSEIYTMQSDGSRKRRITFNDKNDILPHWSPNDINLLITREGEKYQNIFKILLKEELQISIKR